MTDLRAAHALINLVTFRCSYKKEFVFSLDLAVVYVHNGTRVAAAAQGYLSVLHSVCVSRHYHKVTLGVASASVSHLLSCKTSSRPNKKLSLIRAL